MNLRICLIASVALLTAAGSAGAGNAVSDNHPEAAYPDNAPPLFSPGPNADVIKRVQEKLAALGFDAGPANGEFGTKTQAALAQFQLSELLPASGALDEHTLAALGVDAAPAAPNEHDEPAAAGESSG
jgi:peptidoglycan hydrolase-like protein with peptidoglycan-binding domain